MKPVLYSKDARSFLNNGIGILSDTTSCLCTEVRNGTYELELKTSKDGLFVQNIELNSIIKVKPNRFDDPQPFRVYDIDIVLDGTVVVKAAHISYDTEGIPILPFTSSSLNETIGYMNSNRVLSKNSEFKLSSDFDLEKTMEVKDPASFRSLLGGSDNSIATIYGGDYHYDKFDIKLLSRRGVDRGVCFRYRKNLIEFDQETNSEKIYSGVFGYWKKSGSNGAADTFVYGDIITIDGAVEYDKILLLDVSDKLEVPDNEVATSDQINDYVWSYIQTESIGVMTYSMKISYADDESVINIGVGDTVGIVLPEYKIRVRARCNKVVYDCLLDRNESIEIGDIDNGLSDDLEAII